MLPANFTNLFTDRYSSDHGATHKSGTEWREGDEASAPRSHAVGAYCDRESRVYEDAFRSPTEWKTYSDRSEVKAVVNMNAGTCWALPSIFRMAPRAFCGADSADDERERNGRARVSMGLNGISKDKEK